MVAILRSCSLGEFLQVRHAGHGAVVVHDLADDRRRLFSPARRARSTEPSVWPVRTSTPPLRARMGKTWPGLTRSSGRALSATAVRMVVARSAAEMPGGDAPPGLDGDGEGGLEAATGCPGPSGASCSCSTSSGVQGQADETPAVAGHEIDGLGGDLLRGHGQVAFVLPVLVVHQDDHLPLADVVDGCFYGCYCHVKFPFSVF